MTETAVTVPSMPLFAYEITPEMKAEFVELIADGNDPGVAAAKVGTTGTQMKKHYSGNSRQYYDPDFGAVVKQILNGDDRDERQEALVREYQWAAAERGVWQAIEKLSLVHDRKWEKLRHQNFHHTNVKVELVKFLSPEALDEAIAAMEEAERGGQQPLRLLEAGDDTA